MADDEKPGVSKIPDGNARRLANLRPFQPGNPGRPKGSRNKLAEDFVADLHAKWQEKGIAVIDAVIAEKPADFLKVVANVIPKEVKIDRSAVEDIPDAELSDYLAIARAAFEAHRASGAGAGEADGREQAQGVSTLQ